MSSSGAGASSSSSSSSSSSAAAAASAADSVDAPPPSKRAAVGALNVQRRTWDRDEFEARAKERLEKDLAGESSAVDGKKEPAPYRAAPAGLVGPAGSERAYVQARSYDLDIEAKLGKRRLVTEATPQAQVGGYWCELCQCTLRDSTNYLDHINGEKHQKRMGFTLRVERSSVEQVKARFERLKQVGAGRPAGGAPCPDPRG